MINAVAAWPWDIANHLDSPVRAGQNVHEQHDRPCMRASLSTESTDELIVKWRGGDTQALQDLLPLVYEELRRVARKHLRGERASHTLQTTALIHEAYLRLVGNEGAKVHRQDHRR